MAAKLPTSKYNYTRSYGNFRGVELGGDGSGIDKSRLSYAENMWRDYDGDGGGIIESIPGYRRIEGFGGKIHSIYLQKVGEGKDYLLIHAGTALYRMKVSERDQYRLDMKIATLEDKKCAHFSHGGKVYILSDKKIIEVNEQGEAIEVGTEGAVPYSPIITMNGEPYEQKNLLTGSFRARLLLSDPSEYTYCTPGLKFTVLDSVLGTCAVSGIDRMYTGELYIPSIATIGGKRYKVIEISEQAFSLCTLISEIHVAEGVEIIRNNAFSYCTRAKKIFLPRSVHTIEHGAFDNCHEMTDVYLGAGLKTLGGAAFIECWVLERIHYAGTSEAFDAIEGKEEADEYEIVYSDEDRSVELTLPISSACTSVCGVTENGEETDFVTVVENGSIVGVRVNSKSAWDRVSDFLISAYDTEQSYDFSIRDKTYNGYSAITGCTVAEVFDNRVFLSGNPELPNTVFYSSIERAGMQNPLYFGALNYFNDGVGGYPVRAILAANDSLAVFKSGDDGSGSIFYHTPTVTGDDYVPKIYPTSYVHSGIGTYGAAISFMDDPIFLGDGGVYALTKKAINYERSVVCRSHNVNYDLLKGDLTCASMTKWKGYLVVLVGEKAYLGDSRATFTHRTGGSEYEWFLLNGLGSYEGDTPVWRYDSRSIGNLAVHENPGEIYPGTVYSKEIDGENVYYGIQDGVEYSIYTTGERAGGSFFPATAVLGAGELLFFGTESGAVMVFNNDKRGTPPDVISDMADFDPEEYKRVMGRRIHPLYYSFDNHAVRYSIKTLYDDCGIPHLTKSTVKHSLVVKCRCYSEAEVLCEVGTNSSEYKEVTRFPGGVFSFSEMNLEALALSPADYASLPISEKEGGWTEKQITLFTEGYACPIGIASISYRYYVKGKIKRS